LDDLLASDEPLAALPEKLFQGPIADALTMSGRSRYWDGWPERWSMAKVTLRRRIVAGRVGREQAAAKREFD